MESKSKTFRTENVFLDCLICSKDSEFFGFELDPDAALLLFHENGGLDRLNCNDFSTEKTSLLFKPISIFIKMYRKLPKAVDYNGDLFACGACGVRPYSQNNYSTFRLDDPLLLPLQLKNKDVSKHNSLGEFKSVCSVFEHPKDTKLRFYIHPELVKSSSTSDIFSLKLCSSCVNSLRKNKIPKLSIADGYDYGRVERLPEMQSLTLVEKHLIALIRLYITEVKLVAPLGDSISATGPSSLVGNIICFPHDGSKAAAPVFYIPQHFHGSKTYLIL